MYGKALRRRTGLQLTESEIRDRFGIRHDASSNLWAIHVMAVQTALQNQDRRARFESVSRAPVASGKAPVT